MNILDKRIFFYLLSLLVIIPGVISLGLNGLRLGVDFTGGSLLEIRIEKEMVAVSEVEAAIESGYEVQSIQPLSNTTFQVRSAEITADQKEKALQSLRDKFGSVREEQFAIVGPSLSQELIRKTVTATVLVAGLILIYISRQFKDWKFGLSAILAMLHDTLILIGSFSLLGKLFGIEVDVLFVTALLTTLSFSVHDTIVVFDRVRELRKKHPRSNFEATVSAAVLETLGRSINNSMTIIIMLLSLVILGGQSIFSFALALLIGAVTGTYSSTFTAAPLLIDLNSLSKRKRKI